MVLKHVSFCTCLSIFVHYSENVGGNGVVLDATEREIEALQKLGVDEKSPPFFFQKAHNLF
jgi:hypothetical protein